MGRQRRPFARPLGNERYRKLFVIASEGAKTEPKYFDMFCHDTSLVIQLKCLKGDGKSSPPQVLQRMERYLKQEGLRSSDEAWLVVDRDRWTAEQLEQIYRWEKGHDHYNIACSNPKFEYWLLLHFEEGDKIDSSQACTHRLKCHLPGYDKEIHVSTITQKQIDDAIRRAKQRDNPPCTGWPRVPGTTTVYRLIESILRQTRSPTGMTSD